METLSEVSCSVCGISYTPKRSTSKYCSQKCKSKHNLESKNKHNREKRVRVRQVLNEIKLEKGCAECGYNKHPAALDFNHRDPSTKLFTISQSMLRPLAQLLAEAEKCDVLCANCHRIHTHEQGQHTFTRMGTTGTPGTANPYPTRD
jgi:hypothetical protein